MVIGLSFCIESLAVKTFQVSLLKLGYEIVFRNLVLVRERQKLI